MNFLTFLLYFLISSIILILIILLVFRIYTKRKCNIFENTALKAIDDYFDAYDHKKDDEVPDEIPIVYPESNKDIEYLSEEDLPSIYSNNNDITQF